MGVTNFQHNINTMALVINDGGAISQIVKKINTGSYTYTIVADFNPGMGLKYSINKRFVNNKDLGTIYVDRVNRYCVDYHSYCHRIPNSVCRAISQHYNALADALGVQEI